MSIALTLTPTRATVRPLQGARSLPAVRPLGPVRTRRLPLPWLLVGLGGVLLPWLGVLAASGEWNWVGLDALEAVGLIATGLLLRRADPRHCLTAAATAVLLLTDAWFDTATAAPGTALGTALAEAVLVELPLALLCARLALGALRALRQP